MVKGLVIHYYPPKGLAEPLDKCLADSSTRTKSNRVMQNATEMISQLIHNPPPEKQHLSVFDWQADNLIRTSKAASQDDTCNKMIFKKVCSNRKKKKLFYDFWNLHVVSPMANPHFSRWEGSFGMHWKEAGWKLAASWFTFYLHV